MVKENESLKVNPYLRNQVKKDCKVLPRLRKVNPEIVMKGITRTPQDWFQQSSKGKVLKGGKV